MKRLDPTKSPDPTKILDPTDCRNPTKDRNLAATTNRKSTSTVLRAQCYRMPAASTKGSRNSPDLPEFFEVELPKNVAIITASGAFERAWPLYRGFAAISRLSSSPWM